MTNQLCPNIWVFFEQNEMKFVIASPSKLEGPHLKVILGDFPLFMEKATCAQPLPCPKEKSPTKIGHRCERYWLLIWAPAFEQHMELPPQNKQCQPNKYPTCLEFEVFICYLGAHDSGHHPTQGDAFSSM